MSSGIRTVGDVRREKLAADARAELRDEVRQAQAAANRTRRGFDKYGGPIRRLARMRAGRHLRELLA